MKTLNKKRNNKIMYLALAIIAIVAGMFLMTDLTIGTSIIAAAPFMVTIGTKSFELNENEQKLYEAITGYVDQKNKDYISETKMSELIVGAFKDHKVDLSEVGEYKELKEALVAQGLSIKALKENGKTDLLTFSKEFEYEFEKHKDAIMNLKKGGSVRMELKTAATIISAGNFASGVNLGYRENQVDGTLPNEYDLLNLVQTMNGGVGSNPLSWVERAKLNGGAAGVAENSAKPLMDISWTEAEANARTIAVLSTVTKRAANNRATFEQEVREELLINLKNELNRQIISGADTTAEIKGIMSIYAKTYAATLVVGSTANKWDVLLDAYKISRKAYKGSRPNAILVPIGMAVEMDMQKDSTGQYLFPAFMINQEKSLKGIPIIESDDIPEGEFLIGDFTKYLFNFTQPITIELGYTGDQFAYNQYTIRAELEGMGRVKAQYKDSFVKGTFSTAITDLTS